MSKDLTYILGAGASFQSIPVVKTFNKRFLQFGSYLASRGKIFADTERQKHDEAAKAIAGIFNDFSSHQSFDTYFKKLFHFGDSAKINLGKRLLNLYFLWEHSSSSMAITALSNKPNFEIFEKQSQFDKRYDALIAGLLYPISGSSEPICNVNFISWNYDINLLHSIKNFFYSNMLYKDFLKKVKKSQFLWEIGSKIKIVNVNGSFYSSNINSVADLTNINMDNFIEEKVNNGYHVNKSIDEDAEGIRFAWELGDLDKRSLNDTLCKIIRGTENLVVIGYTFPLYNRLIDLGYLRQEDLLSKEIVIQDPQAEVLKKNLLDIYRISEGSKIQIVPNCDSFYVPSSVFGIEEYKKPMPVLAG
jgi:hypothetical protein